MHFQNNNSPAVFVDELTVIIGTVTVLQEISFEVNRGEMIGVIGPNGGGKTTLLQTLLGLIKPFSGRALLLGCPCERLGPIREKIGYIPQYRNYDRRFPLSAEDVVKMGFYSPRTLLRPLKREEKEACREILSVVGALHLAARPFGDLSGGEQQRVLLARALVRHPELLLLDEPNTGLDLTAQHHFLERLRQLQRDYKLTVLLVSHDILSLAGYADRLLCINRSMHIHGQPQQVLQSPALKKAYRCSYDLLEMTSAHKEDPS